MSGIGTHGNTWSGGTALGAVQVRVAKAIKREKGGKLPLRTAGGSTGALTAAMEAEDRLDDLEILYSTEVKSTRFFQAPNADFWNGLFALKPLRRELARNRVAYELKTDCYVGVVDLGRQKYQSVHLNPLSIKDRHDAIICSCTQPIIHEEAYFQGRMCDDSGVLHLMPLILLDGITDLHATFCSPIGKGRRRVRTQAELKKGARRSAAIEMLYSSTVKKDVRRLRKLAKTLPVWVYAPEKWPDVGDPFDASHETLNKRIPHGDVLYTHRTRF